MVNTASTCRTVPAEDENVGLALLRHDLAGGVAPTALEYADGSRADGHETPSPGVDGNGGVRGDLETFGVHAVFAQVVRLDGPERADPDVQRQKGVRDRREDLRVKCSPAVGAATAPGARAKTVW